VTAYEGPERVHVAVGDGLNEQTVREIVVRQMKPVSAPADAAL
jgi:hypothetical protein